jgi:hemoglobin/transferrin/lactoferrin receptor protein
MKYLIYLWVVIGLCYASQAQVITITDQETSDGLELVTLLSDEPRATAVTNAKGQANLSAFAGAARIEIRCLGFKTVYKSYEELVSSGFVLALPPAFVEMDEVVVSATRWNQSSKRVPSKVVSIRPAQVALFNPQTAADLLGSSGEVFIQKSQQGGGSPMIRGFATNRLLYAVDGVRMNTAIFRAGNIQNVISLDPFAIEQTEVFFGPGSIIYGSDAIGGVMSFQTLQPQFSYDSVPLLKANAVSRFSSANQEVSNHFDLKAGWKKWASVTSFTYSKFGNLRMGKYGPEDYLKRSTVIRQDSLDRVVENQDPRVQDPSGYSQINLMQKIRYQPVKHVDLQYAFHYSETSDYSRYDRMVEFQPNGRPGFAVWNYGPQVWMMNHLTATYDRRSKLFNRATLRVAHQYFQESRIDRRFGNSRLRTQLEEVRAFSVNLDLEKSAGAHRLYYGAEYVLNDVNSRGSARNVNTGAPVAVPDRYPGSEWTSMAAYLNYQYAISERWLVQTGVRYNAFQLSSDFNRHLAFFPFDFSQSSLSNAATTGSLGLVYNPDDHTKISLNGNTGFRAPNVDDIGKIFEFGPGEVVVPNTNLKAEYAYNGELNLSRQFGKRLKLDVTGFYTYLDAAMVRRPFRVNGQDSITFDGDRSRVFAIQNAAYARVYGFHAGIDLDLSGGFSISSRYNFQRGEEEMDNGTLSRSRHAAPAFGITRLSYQAEGVQLQIYAQYSAEVGFDQLNPEEQLKPFIYAKDAQGRPYSPAWYTLNIKAMVRLNEAWTLTAGVENLTDQRYRPYSSGLVAPGRNLILALRASL